MKMKVKTERSSNIVQAVLIGIGASIAVLLLGTVLLTYLINAEKLAQSTSGVGTLLIQITASLIGAFTASKLTGGKYAMTCAVNGAMLLVLMMIGALLLSDSINSIWQGSLAVAGGSIGACVLCLLTERKTNGVKRRSR